MKYKIKPRMDLLNLVCETHVNTLRYKIIMR